jgi:hypothetical protein
MPERVIRIDDLFEELDNNDRLEEIDREQLYSLRRHPARRDHVACRRRTITDDNYLSSPNRKPVSDK